MDGAFAAGAALALAGAVAAESGVGLVCPAAVVCVGQGGRFETRDGEGRG